jgi:hypothetical protein
MWIIFSLNLNSKVKFKFFSLNSKILYSNDESNPKFPFLKYSKALSSKLFDLNPWESLKIFIQNSNILLNPPTSFAFFSQQPSLADIWSRVEVHQVKSTSLSLADPRGPWRHLRLPPQEVLPLRASPANAIMRPAPTFSAPRDWAVPCLPHPLPFKKPNALAWRLPSLKPKCWRHWRSTTLPVTTSLMPHFTIHHPTNSA